MQHVAGRFPGSCLCPLRNNSIKNSGDTARYRLGPPRQTRFNRRCSERVAVRCRESQETAQFFSHGEDVMCDTVFCQCVCVCARELSCASAACIFGGKEGRKGGSLPRKAPENGTRLHHNFRGAMSRDALDNTWRRLLVVGSGLPSLGNAPHGRVLWCLIVSVIRVLQRRTRQHHDVILSSIISSNRDPTSKKSR